MGLRILGAAILAIDTQAEVLLVGDLGPQKAAELAVLVEKSSRWATALWRLPHSRCDPGLHVEVGWQSWRGLTEREGLLRLLRRVLSGLERGADDGRGGG